jgi:beta-galactosidase
MPRRSTLVYLAFVLFFDIPARAASQFSGDFAPSEGWVKPQQSPYRAEVCLNGKWDFQPVAVPAGFVRDTGVPPELPLPAAGAWETTPIKVPSPWNVNDWGSGGDAGPGTGHPFWPGSCYYPSYPKSWEHVEMGWLRRKFDVPKGWVDRRIILHFEAVAGECQVLVNGKKAGGHFDSYLPFELDITSLIDPKGDNELLVGVRHHRLFDQTSATYPHFRATYPPGSETERLAGIWQDVYLLALPPVRVEDAFAVPLVDRGVLELTFWLRNDTPEPREVSVSADVLPWINLAGNAGLSASEPRWKLGDAALSLPSQRTVLPAGGQQLITLRQNVHDQLKFWGPASPNLYGVIATVTGGATPIDRHFSRFGWRQLKIKGRDLLLNGEKIQLFGDLSHPFGPFVMSRRFAWAWFQMIKDFGGNAVRPHAQPWPRAYLDMADEMGIMVLDETALFGSSVQLNFEDPHAWQRYTDHYDSLVRRDRNHPSVFGWSFGNELFAIFEQNHVPKVDAAGMYRQLMSMGLFAREIDPTRDWISCDGDEDLQGTLPVWSKHLGHGLQDIAYSAKPQMIGESGGTYYATPKQLSVFNGDRAYESYAGRNEALAIDLYQNVVKMARPELAYYSASEMVWFGLEHLSLGYNDFTRLPTVEDGVFFPPYAEGKPGMQPERVPPYVTTLNPGLDPHLPLYKPLAMFNAMKAALAPGGPQPCRWDHLPDLKKPVARPPEPTIDRVAFAGDIAGNLHQQLLSWGVPLVDGDEGVSAKCLMIDAEGRGDAPAELRRKVDAVHEGGGTVMVIAPRQPANIDAVSLLLPAAIGFTNRAATQLICSHDDARMAGLSADDLYFAESDGDRHIIKCGLTGPFVERGTVLLEASNTDWGLFNRVPEVAKCAAVELYERQVKPSGAALVEIADGQGKTLISTIDFGPGTEKHIRLARGLFGRLGIKLTESSIHWALPIAIVAEKGVVWRYTLETPGDQWEQPGFNDGRWKSGEAGFGTDVPNSKVRTPWTTFDIWLRREVAIPDKVGRNLKLLVHHDEDVQIYLNGGLIYQASGFVTSYQAIPFTAEMLKTLHPGANVLAVHCKQTVGGQYIDVGLLDGTVPASITAGIDKPTHDLLLDGPGGK